MMHIAAAFNKRAGNAIFKEDILSDRIFLSADEDKINVDYMVKHFKAVTLAKTQAGRDSAAYARLVMEMADTLAEVLDHHATDDVVIRLVPDDLQRPDLAPAFAAQGAAHLAKLVARFR
jgi:hypothetical protein